MHYFVHILRRSYPFFFLSVVCTWTTTNRLRASSFCSMVDFSQVKSSTRNFFRIKFWKKQFWSGMRSKRGDLHRSVVWHLQPTNSRISFRLKFRNILDLQFWWRYARNWQYVKVKWYPHGLSNNAQQPFTCPLLAKLVVWGL